MNVTDPHVSVSPAPADHYLNVLAYRFALLDDLEHYRRYLQQCCDHWQLKGTILLSPEGINLNLSGRRHAVEAVQGELGRWPELAGLEYRSSWSAEPPFHRMHVRIKREIIAFGQPGIDPARQTSPRVSAAELKCWLDEDRPLTLLDVRNQYEIDVGSFEKARAIGIDCFRDFPVAATELPEPLQHQPLVMFCTGGIRCEKAGPWLEHLGFAQVLQLEGGILKYFEQVGGAHYRGQCFVFDQRIAIDSQLRETRKH